MSNDIQILAVMGVLTACATALLLVPVLAPVARRIGLVDHPGGRKVHVGDIPLIGGLAIFLAFVISLVVTGNFALWGWATLLIWTIIVALSLWNDIRHIPVVIRVLVQVTAIAALCSYTGIQLRSLGNLLGQGPVQLGPYSLPITVLGLIGVKNGINLIDGLDGLAGTQVLASLFWFALLCVVHPGRPELLLTTLLLSGAVLGFLTYNLRFPGRPAGVFLGDHGSVFLGFSMAWVAVVGSQGEQVVFAPIEAVWVLGLPILDTIRVMLSRMVRGTSPFTPGRDHLHHLLVDSGMSVNSTVLLLFSMSMCLGGAVWIGRWSGLSEVFMFCAFLAVSVVFFLCGQYLDLKVIRHRSPGAGLYLWR